MVFRHWLLQQKASPQIFDRILGAPLIIFLATSFCSFYYPLCTFSLLKKSSLMFSLSRTLVIFCIIDNPVCYDCCLFFNRSGSFTEKILLFRKCFFQLVPKTLLTFQESKKFGKFRFFSNHSFTLFVKSFYISDYGKYCSRACRIATLNCHKTGNRYPLFFVKVIAFIFYQDTLFYFKCANIVILAFLYISTVFLC